jgi:hypothetical protein
MYECSPRIYKGTFINDRRYDQYNRIIQEDDLINIDYKLDVYDKPFGYYKMKEKSGRIVCGVLHGLCMHVSDEGVTITGTYMNNKKEGWFKHSWEEGRIEQRYHNDKPVGLEYEYDGDKLCITCMRDENGKVYGDFIRYYEDGSIQSIDKLRNGVSCRKMNFNKGEDTPCDIIEFHNNLYGSVQAVHKDSDGLYRLSDGLLYLYRDGELISAPPPAKYLDKHEVAPTLSDIIQMPSPWNLNRSEIDLAFYGIIPPPHLWDLDK